MANRSLKIPPLPPGFELETSESTLPPLPQGFELESSLNQDSPGRGLARALYQPIGGAISFTRPSLLGQLASLIGSGEALAELPELQERLPDLKEKFPMLNWPEKIDEESYMQALETAQNITQLLGRA
ncbi:hypothetical protein HC928_07820 [bacterium]|nr:hypothetical protein [bacterium]